MEHVYFFLSYLSFSLYKTPRIIKNTLNYLIKHLLDILLLFKFIFLCQSESVLVHPVFYEPGKALFFCSFIIWFPSSVNLLYEFPIFFLQTKNILDIYIDSCYFL